MYLGKDCKSEAASKEPREIQQTSFTDWKF